MSDADTLLQNALAAHRGGQLDLAARQYREFLTAHPERADVWNLLGMASRQQGALAEAIEQLIRAIELNPALPAAFGNLGETYRALGRVDEAIACYERARLLVPNIAEVHQNLATLYHQATRYDDACASYQQALSLDPSYADAHYNLGNTYQARRQWDEAIASYRRAIELAPDYVEAQCNLGNALWEKGLCEDALPWLDSALRLRPDYVPALSNRSVVLQWLGRLTEAERSLRRALELAPELPQLHLNLGTLLKCGGDFAGSLAAYETALRLRPEDPEAVLARATLQLAHGQFESGWAGYERRTGLPEYDTRTFAQPRWQGERLAGRTLLVHCEQGFGDTIQFIRYLKLLVGLGGPLVVAAPAALLPLLRTSGIDNLVSLDQPLPRFDLQVPLMSLPFVLGTRLETVPHDVPYLQVEPERVAHWRAELLAERGFKTGIAWQGRREYRADRQRSLPLLHFAPLAAVPGVRLLSLQKGYGSEQLTALAGRFNVADLSVRLDQGEGAFLDTAAAMQSLDLVVTSDTAIAHLAGALGVRVWLALGLVPDWRWMLAGERSPWYPTMRLFRQRVVGDWHEVFARMAGELTSLVTRP
jgi:Tfp pilus assembly protein PilF